MAFLLRGGVTGHTAGFYNFLGGNMAAYQSAVAAARNAIVLCTGDSITEGYGSTGGASGGNSKSAGYPTKLAQALSGGSWSSVVNNNNVSSGSFAYDSRLSATNWVSDAAVASLSGHAYRCDSPNVNAFSFTPTNSVDTFDVYYERAAGNGTATLDIGGSVLDTTSTNGANAVVKASITVALGAHTLNIKRSSGGSVYVTRVVAYNSASKETTVLNAGGIGQYASDFTSTSAPWSPGSEIAAIVPDLVIAMFGTNDWVLGKPLATFQADLQSQISNVLGVGGNIVLMSDPPTDSGTTPTATQATYVAVINSLAYANGVPFIDAWNLFGGDWSVANSRGWMSDALHPSGTGYTQIAGFAQAGLANGFLSS